MAGFATESEDNPTLRKRQTRTQLGDTPEMWSTKRYLVIVDVKTRIDVQAPRRTPRANTVDHRRLKVVCQRLSMESAQRATFSNWMMNQREATTTSVTAAVEKTVFGRPQKDRDFKL